MIWAALLLVGGLLLVGFLFALLYGTALVVVHGVNFIVHTVLFVVILARVHWEESAARMDTGVEPHQMSWRFVCRVFRDFRAGVYEREMEEEANLR